MLVEVFYFILLELMLVVYFLVKFLFVLFSKLGKKSHVPTRKIVLVFVRKMCPMTLY